LNASLTILRRYFWRGLWAVMWAAHVPAFVSSVLSTGADATAIGRVLLLGASLAFFLAKALDVPALKFQWNARALAAGAVMVVLLHANAIERSLPADLDTPAAWHLVVLAAPAIAVGAAVTLWLRCRRPVRRSVAARVRALCRSGQRLAERALLPPRFLPLARSSLADRAPPALA